MELNIEAPARHGREWTPDEIIYVEANANLRSWRELATELGRRQDNVYTTFVRLAGGRAGYNGHELAELLGIPPMTARSWIQAGYFGRSQRYQLTPRASGAGPRMYRVPYERVLDFLCDPWYFWLFGAVAGIGDEDLVKSAHWSRVEYGDLYVELDYLEARCYVTRGAILYWCHAGRLPTAQAPGGQGGTGRTYITPRAVADAWIAEYVDAGRPPRHCAPAAHAAAAEATGFDAEIAAPWRPAWRWPAEE